VKTLAHIEVENGPKKSVCLSLKENGCSQDCFIGLVVFVLTTLSNISFASQQEQGSYMRQFITNEQHNRKNKKPQGTTLSFLLPTQK